MRRTGRIGAPDGRGPHDHVCWLHDGGSAWPDAVARYLGEGARAGERLLYVADTDSRAGGPVALAGLGDRDALLASGQLAVLPPDEVFGTIEPLATAARLVPLRERAVAAIGDGYAALRVAADASALAAGGSAARRFAAYELLLDEVVVGAPLTVLCGYDRTLVGGDVAGLLGFLHPLRGAVDPPAGPGRVDGAGSGGLHAGDEGWWLTGRVDRRACEALEVALAALAVSRGDRDVHLALADLESIDVGGVRALVGLAARLGPLRRLVVHDPPAVLLRILRTCWWGGVPGLVVAA